MDITLTAFPAEELAAIAQWRSDREVHRYLRHGYTTLADIRAWYRDYFSAEANCLLGIRVDTQLIGYCTIEHIDHENHKGEVGLVISEKDYWHRGSAARYSGSSSREPSLHCTCTGWRRSSRPITWLPSSALPGQVSTAMAP